nr:ImmA/IrrE family metallo-endopeptidase [uncultured Brevundimonas sp.]
MASSYEDAVRNGTQVAGRLQRQLGLRARLEARPGAVDVFDIIAALDLPLLLRPLKGLLGAYLETPQPGLLVTTERPLSIQRFTAAHELGHCLMKHKPSLDDEEQILRRGPLRTLQALDARTGFQEAEADAFAVALLMPKWLIQMHCARQDWHTDDLARPPVIYQLSLRLGASYEALVRTLERYSLIDAARRTVLLTVERRGLKAALLEDYRPASFHGDVWRLTAKDAGGRIEGRRIDHVVVDLTEQAGAGYLWDESPLSALDFKILRDERRSENNETVGGAVLRRLLAAAGDAVHGDLILAHRRPWAPHPPLDTVSVSLDLTGPETKGLSRAEKHRLLEAA